MHFLGNQLRSATKTSNREQALATETGTTILSRPNSRLGTTNLLHYENELTVNGKKRGIFLKN